MNNRVDKKGWMFVAFARTGDPSLRDQLVLKHLGLVKDVAKQFLNSGQPIEDLIQEGTIGLIKAVDRFNPGQGVQFNTYADHSIDGAIRHYIRDHGKLVREPGWHGDLHYRILKAQEKIEADGRTATAQAIAEVLNVSEQIVEQLLASGIVFETKSFDEPRYGDFNDETDSLGDAIGVDHRWTERQNTILTVRDAIGKLPCREQRIIRYFFYEELTKKEIARQLGISVNYSAYLLRGRSGAWKPYWIHLLSKHPATTRSGCFC